MNKVKEILNRFFEWVKKWKWWIFHTISILIMLTIAVWGAWDAYHCKHLIGEGKPITLEYLVGFLVTITTIYIFVWRVVNQEKQINIQIKKEVDDRFTTAVNLLGSSETSARTGAIYSLYQQAVEHEKYRKQIVRILCSHIRSKTQEPDYQEHHKNRPSNEIQTTIDLLFRETESKGLYPQFRKELPNANLSYAYCAGADFIEAECQGADFKESHCQGAYFLLSNCQGANFRESHCQGINFGGAYCQGASFREAECQGAYFGAARCQGISFVAAHCQGICFVEAHCEGADFERAHCQGADFRIAHCEGADFRIAHCQGADFERAHCQGADFERAHCQGADSSGLFQSLADRIGKDTELEVVLEKPLHEWSIDAIEEAKPYCLSHWYSQMQKIIEANKGKEEKRGTPAGIVSGKLEDSEELQKIIKLLKEIEEREPD